MEGVLDSREQARESSNLIVHTVWAGEYARSLPLLESEGEAALARGQLARAARGMFIAAGCSTALGRFEEARGTLERAQHLIDRLGVPVFALLESRARLALATGEVDEDLAATFEHVAAAPHPAAVWGLGWIYGNCATFAVWQDRPGDALRFLQLLVPWLERAPAWTMAESRVRGAQTWRAPQGP